ncbi:hypothetical protein D3C87_1707430 [compost metagenome]
MDALNGNPNPLKLRTGDEFKHLEELAEEIHRRMQELKKERTVQVVEFKEDKKE